MTTTIIYLKNAINECDQLIERYKNNQKAKMLIVQADVEKKALRQF